MNSLVLVWNTVIVPFLAPVVPSALLVFPASVFLYGAVAAVALGTVVWIAVGVNLRQLRGLRAGPRPVTRPLPQHA